MIDNEIELKVKNQDKKFVNEDVLVLFFITIVHILVIRQTSVALKL